MLYLVATPIGNLGDISLHALEVLRSVDVIASEDTRRTGILLKHYNISKPQMAFEEHNEERAGARIMELLSRGKSVALVTEAGTPGISDPGFTLVRRAVAAGEDVTMIPGASTVLMALVLSGLAVHSFTFRGFRRANREPRRRFLAVDHHSPHTLVFYESPYRLAALLSDAREVYGDRPAAVAHELTKVHESVLRGTLSELIEQVRAEKARGEYVVVIAGAGGPDGKQPFADAAYELTDGDEVEDDDGADAPSGPENDDKELSIEWRRGVGGWLTSPGCWCCWSSSPFCCAWTSCFISSTWASAFLPWLVGGRTSALGGLRIQRQLCDHMFLGQVNQVAIEIRNTRWWPVPWLRVDEAVPP